MNAERTLALANLIDALRREQAAEGMQVFCLLSEDRISMTDAETIVTALRERAARHGEPAR